jgi:hypothetical protein
MRNKGVTGMRQEGVTGMREAGGYVPEARGPRPAASPSRRQVTGRYARHADMLCSFLVLTSLVSHARDALPFGHGPSCPWCPIIRVGGGNRGLGEAFEAWARHGHVEKREGIKLTLASRCG